MLETAEPEQFVEFRCTRCWHSNCAAASQCNASVQCTACQAELVVPEATPERIARAEAMMRQGNSQQATEPDDLTSLSSAQQYALVRNEAHLPLADMNFANAPNASHLARFVAVLADGIVDGLACALGIGTMIGLMYLGLLTEPIMVHEQWNLNNIEALAVFSFPLLVVKIIQWNLIATRGQSLGKMLMFIRIVTTDGQIPGFVSGVLLRNWLRAALSSIPFFGLIDALFIFSESRRCIHDYLAGTRVVNG